MESGRRNCCTFRPGRIHKGRLARRTSEVAKSKRERPADHWWLNRSRRSRQVGTRAFRPVLGAFDWSSLSISFWKNVPVPLRPIPSKGVIFHAGRASVRGTRFSDHSDAPVRYQPAVRNLVRQTRLSPANLILPIFVRAGEGVRQEISSMPGHFQLSPDLLVEEIRQIAGLGLGGVLLFGIPAEKDPVGSDSTSDQGIIPRAIRAIKQAAPELLVSPMSAFANTPATATAGRSPIRPDGPTWTTTPRFACSDNRRRPMRRAGADIVAPSGMMDGMVGESVIGLTRRGLLICRL